MLHPCEECTTGVYYCLWRSPFSDLECDNCGHRRATYLTPIPQVKEVSNGRYRVTITTPHVRFFAKKEGGFRARRQDSTHYVYAENQLDAINQVLWEVMKIRIDGVDKL